MDALRRTKGGVAAFGLAVLLLLAPLVAGSEEGRAEGEQRPAEQMLLEIAEMHGRLATNEAFLAQAAMLSVYLQAAQQFEEASKVKVYATVLSILEHIQNAPVPGPASAEPASAAVAQSQPAQAGTTPQAPAEEASAAMVSRYKPGAAILEVFKTESMDKLPDLPVFRTYWRHDLACSDRSFVLPERVHEVGDRGVPYVAKFSFYYEAKQPGRYGFIAHCYRPSNSKLMVGGITVLSNTADGTRGRRQPPVVSQGICNLERGMHRIEFWHGTAVSADNYPHGDSAFRVHVLPAGAFDAVPLTKDMMLLRADQVEASQQGQPIKPGRKPVPYVDY